MFTAVIVELEGILVDTAGARAGSLIAAFASESILLPSRVAEDLEADRSASFDDLVRHVAAALTPGDPTPHALDDTALAILALRAEREYAIRLTSGVTLADGAREAIEALSAEWRVTVVTAWRRIEAERVLALAGLDGNVRFVIARDDGPGFASAHGRFARAVARLRPEAAADSALVVALVADADGMTAARAAGARPVLVGVPGVGVSLVGLTLARLRAILDAAARAPAPSSQLPPPSR